MLKIDTVLNCFLFQLTRSVGSVTHRKTYDSYRITISTHTLRGERDDGINTVPKEKDISTHTLRGERDKICWI